jgi:predicted nucleotidyltransferase
MSHEEQTEERGRPLDRIVAAIRDGYGPEKIILFGSHARGTPGADSDLDLLIVKRSDSSEAERIREVSRLLRPRPAPLDILVKTPEEIEQRLAIKDSFIEQILREGTVLYDRRAQ